MNAAQRHVKTEEPVGTCWGILNVIALKIIMEDNAKLVSGSFSSERSRYLESLWLYFILLRLAVTVLFSINNKWFKPRSIGSSYSIGQSSVSRVSNVVLYACVGVAIKYRKKKFI